MHRVFALHIIIRLKKNLYPAMAKVIQRYGNRRGRRMDWIYMKGIPIEAQYLYRKALELSKMERYETAVRYFRQAVVIAPGYSKAFYEMGNCLANLGQYDEAIALYNRALHIDPLNTEAQIKRDMAITNRELNNTGYKSNGKSTLLPSH
jgi:tetratricopeptide (TPR) repeat protein